MNRFIYLVALSVFSLRAFALSSANLDLHGYMRTGVGSNNKGGDQTCINNNGGSNWVGGNEFRLGNECDKIYSELTFVIHNRKPGKGNGPRWKTQFLWAYRANGNATWEDTSTSVSGTVDTTTSNTKQPLNISTSSNAQMAFREAFVEGSNLFGKNINVWVGKRFYRDVNVNMYDWFYFAEMSGNGAGVSNIDTGIGRLAFAMIHQTDAGTSSDIGNHKGIYYDLRLFDVPVPMLDSHKLNFWLVHGRASGDTDESTYIDATGNLASVRIRSSMPAGFNDLTIMYGAKLMSGMNVYGDTSVGENDDQNRAHRFRLINDMTTKVFGNLETHFSLVYEKRHSGSSNNPSQIWKSAGIRPVYSFNDQLSLAFEIGHSIVNIESDGLGDRSLTRFTISPQLTPNMGIWTRPILRAFMSHSRWNDRNATKMPGIYSDERKATNIGFQAEVWF